MKYRIAKKWSKSGSRYLFSPQKSSFGIFWTSIPRYKVALRSWISWMEEEEAITMIKGDKQTEADRKKAKYNKKAMKGETAYFYWD